MKKLRKFAVAVLALIVFATCGYGAIGSPAKADEALKPVDVYLLMGQSNAAGHTNAASREASAITSQTFPNVLVGGVCQPSLDGTADNFKRLDYSSLTPARRGLGRGPGYIGPEYGMAKALTSANLTVNGTSVPLYDENNKAIIFKYAAGSTDLLNTLVTDADHKYGNWYPRSLQEEAKRQGDGYVAGETGGLYNGVVAAFRTFTENLKSSGYKVTVKGIAWMQGEDDRDQSEAYRKVIQVFVRDLREDLTEITGVDASNALFAMGEISETFRTSFEKAQNKTFIKMQNEVVSSIMPAVTVETGDLPINLPESELAAYGYSKATAIKNDRGDYTVGSDKWHWNAKDMVTLGERFAAAFIGNYGDLYVRIKSGAGGSVEADKSFVSSGESVVCTVKPSAGYKLTSFTVNGEDKLGELIDGKYTSENVTETVLVEATFAAKAEFTIKITGEGLEKGKTGYLVNKSSKKVYEGDTAYVVTSAPDGKRVKSVTFNGNPMTYNEKTERYEYENVTESGTILITFEDSVSAPDNDSSAADNTGNDEQTAPEEKSGCGGKAAVAIASLFALVAAAFVIKS